MVIDGKAIAGNILNELSVQVAKLKEKNITPTLAVILVGDDPGSLSYIKQKQKVAECIGARVIFSHESRLKSPKVLKELIENFNNDPHVHGLIVQRPVPTELGDVTALLNEISPKKDVDGFVPHSPFDVPVAAAVMVILNHIYCSSAVENYNEELLDSPSKTRDRSKDNDFLQWLKKQSIVIIGRGETAGRPIHNLLQKYGCLTTVIHSQTPNAKEILQKADIIISCVGKPSVITKDMIKSGAILISVGLWRDKDGKLHGDYEEDGIKDVASYYTPTPGGVGPVNVACLMQNLVKAYTIQQGGQP